MSGTGNGETVADALLSGGRIGIGTWAIGGPFSSGSGCRYPTGAALGYGRVDDMQSERAVHCALDLGVSVIDTADAYGTGHAEEVLGRALAGMRDRVLVATKFGNCYDDRRRELTGVNWSGEYIRQAVEASLRRLRRDCIDLYQLHLGDLETGPAEEVAGCLEDLCREGLIRAYGWSTDDPVRARSWADRRNAAAVQFDLNLFADTPEMLSLLTAGNLAGMARAPLAMGFLSGKYNPASTLPADDIRSSPPEWLPYFQAGGAAAPEWSNRLDHIREILTSGGRTPAQGALCWILARSAKVLPIPGVRTAEQVAENLGAAAFGPLTQSQMQEIRTLMRLHRRPHSG